MTKKSLCYILTAIVLALSGCSQDFSEIPSRDIKDNEAISRLINNFYQTAHRDCRSTETQFQITDISTITYQLPDSVKNHSRSSISSDSYDIHTVSVDFGETTGYVILSDTPGLDQIFCYTENGCLSDTALIPPLKDFIDATPAIASYILNAESKDSEYQTRSNTEYDIDYLVPYEWHQEDPFNNYATYCTCERCSKRGNHRPVGCCAIAVGEVMATLKNFNGTFYGNRNINFDNLLKYDITQSGLKYYTEAQALAVAHYLQEVAITCQTRYGCEGSSATPQSAVNCLSDNGYKVVLKKGFLDFPHYIKNLQDGRPHIVGGYNNKGNGHMWVIDGIKTSEGTKLIHCNWGWGRTASNGWYSSYYFYYGSCLILF